jgi:hypothetical protein
MRHSVQRSGRQASAQQNARKGSPADPPVRLILAMTVLGMLIGALLAPGPEDDPALQRWLKDLVAIQASADDP